MSKKAGAISGPASATAPTLKQGATPLSIIIARRAERLNNRNRKAADKYIEAHKRLSTCEKRND